MLKVSCLMVTKDRYSEFLLSLDAYCHQTYNSKELVIVSDGPEIYQEFIRDRVRQTKRTDIKVVMLGGSMRLGSLRNVALSEATGPLVCQWDDDDLSHPERLATQVKALQGAGALASYFTEQLHYFADTNELFWCDWTRREGDASKTLIPGTLLGVKSALPRYQPDLPCYEDSVLRGVLIRTGVPIARVQGNGLLLMYRFHGRNTYNRDHHMTIVRTRALAADELRAREPLLKAALGRYPLPPPVTICARAGDTAFVWRGDRVN